MPDNDRSERIKAIAARPAPDLYHSRFSMSPKSDSIRTLTPSPPSSPSRSPNSLVDCNQDITEDSWMSGVSEVTSPIQEVNNLIEPEVTPTPNDVDTDSDSPSPIEPPRESIEVTIQPIHQHSPIKAPSPTRSTSSRTKQPSSRSSPGSSRIASTSPKSKEEVSRRTPSRSRSPRVSRSRKLPPRYLSRWRRRSRESGTGRFKSKSSSRRFRKRSRSPLEKTNRWTRSSKRLRSPRRRSRSPRKRSRSPRKRSMSPRNRSRFARKRSRSPSKRSMSPRNRSMFARQRSRSPRKRSRSPKQWSKSPRKRSRSPRQPERFAEERNRSSSLSPISFMEEIKQKYTREETEEQKMDLSNQKVELNNAKVEVGESSSSNWKKVKEAEISSLLTKRSQSVPVPASELTSPNLPKESSPLPEVPSQLPEVPSQLPKVYSQLPKESSQLAYESSQLPNESPQLPNESSQLPKESSQLPNESSQLISIEGFNWVINRIPDPQTTQSDQTKPVSPPNQSKTTQEVSFQTIKTTYTKLTSTQPKLDNQSTTKCAPVVAPALGCNPFDIRGMQTRFPSGQPFPRNSGMFSHLFLPRIPANSVRPPFFLNRQQAPIPRRTFFFGNRPVAPISIKPFHRPHFNTSKPAQNSGYFRIRQPLQLPLTNSTPHQLNSDILPAAITSTKVESFDAGTSSSTDHSLLPLPSVADTAASSSIYSIADTSPEYPTPHPGTASDYGWWPIPGNLIADFNQLSSLEQRKIESLQRQIFNKGDLPGRFPKNEETNVANSLSERIKAIAARPAPDLYHSRFSMSPESDSIRTLTPSPPSSPSRSVGSRSPSPAGRKFRYSRPSSPTRKAKRTRVTGPSYDLGVVEKVRQPMNMMAYSVNVEARPMPQPEDLGDNISTRNALKKRSPIRAPQASDPVLSKMPPKAISSRIRTLKVSRKCSPIRAPSPQSREPSTKTEAKSPPPVSPTRTPSPSPLLPSSKKNHTSGSSPSSSRSKLTSGSSPEETSTRSPKRSRTRSSSGRSRSPNRMSRSPRRNSRFRSRSPRLTSRRRSRSQNRRSRSPRRCSRLRSRTRRCSSRSRRSLFKESPESFKESPESIKVSTEKNKLDG
eukprot:sb/3461381/